MFRLVWNINFFFPNVCVFRQLVIFCLFVCFCLTDVRNYHMLTKDHIVTMELSADDDDEDENFTLSQVKTIQLTQNVKGAHTSEHDPVIIENPGNANDENDTDSEMQAAQSQHTPESSQATTEEGAIEEKNDTVINLCGGEGDGVPLGATAGRPPTVPQRKTSQSSGAAHVGTKRSVEQENTADSSGGTLPKRQKTNTGGKVRKK